VQAFPSLQEAVLLTWRQAPFSGLQESSVQGLPSLQLDTGPGTQTPAMHESGLVHALPSVQVTLSSTDPSQSSSTPLHTSVAPGWTLGFALLQSPAHPVIPSPSPSSVSQTVKRPSSRFV